MIIGLCGLIGSGKDTVANYLVKNHQFMQLSFASALKDVLCAIFGWSRSQIEGDTPESREWRNQVDDWWSSRLNIPNLTPRKMLQFVGTDLFRKHMNSEIWIASIENKILRLLKTNPSQKIVISDCRFPEEIECIKRLNGQVIKIHRYEPEWSGIAMQASRGCQESIDKLNDLKIHESEWKVWLCSCDQVVVNNGTIEQLYNQISSGILQTKAD